MSSSTRIEGRQIRKLLWWQRNVTIEPSDMSLGVGGSSEKELTTSTQETTLCLVLTTGEKG